MIHRHFLHDGLSTVITIIKCSLLLLLRCITLTVSAINNFGHHLYTDPSDIFPIDTWTRFTCHSSLVTVWSALLDPMHAIDCPVHCTGQLSLILYYSRLVVPTSACCRVPSGNACMQLNASRNRTLAKYSSARHNPKQASSKFSSNRLLVCRL